MVLEIRPQTGPQTEFLTTSADIALYGGAAGGGKTYGLLLENIRHVRNPMFRAVTFRRLSTMVRNEGGLWDTSQEFYPQLGARGSDQMLEWEFPSGATVRFAHMQYESDKLAYQGAQIPLIGFDELTHFSRTQFWYMVSRNRSMSGIKPYIRATCNPDSDSWVKKDFGPWVDDKWPGIKAESGEIRWFIRVNGQMVWEIDGELIQPWMRGPEGERPKSMTFIAANIYDNKILMKQDPGYLANLQALTLVDRARLLGGDWNIAAEPGNIFRREWFEIVDTLPAELEGMRTVRFWDFAATQQKGSNDPDWTAGCKMAKSHDNKIYILDMQHERLSPGSVEKLVKQTAMLDGRDVEIAIEQEPGSSGVMVIDNYVRNVLNGFSISGVRSTGPKGERAKPLSSQAEAGNVYLYDPMGRWVDAFLAESELFPDGSHDDLVDAASGAFGQLFESASKFWDETDTEVGMDISVQLPEREDDTFEYRNDPIFRSKVW